jgi:hypothetical protein
MMNVKFPQKLNKLQIERFFIKKGLGDLVKLSRGPIKKVNGMVLASPYRPELDDLYSLYQFILLNKRTTILEFGSGWSSIIFALALNELKTKFIKHIKNLRRNNPFELFILENERKFLGITKKKLSKFIKKNKLKIKISYCYSDVVMTRFNNRIATEYKKFPLCNPDFIYLDGPDQFNVKGDINGVSTRHKDMMPMVCDILKFEHFYTPGTIIVTDGRAANANFLLKNFQRKWSYKNNKKTDQHIFYLNDSSLGKYNQRQLSFYKD